MADAEIWREAGAAGLLGETTELVNSRWHNCSV